MTQEKFEKSHIGINVFVFRGKKLLLGKRMGGFGAGTWGLPGGHLEDGERMETAAARELEEETGLRAKRFIFTNLINDLTGKVHYLQVGFLAEGIRDNNPLVKEPDLCEKWEWFDLNNLPEKILPGHVKQIQALTEKKYFLE